MQGDQRERLEHALWRQQQRPLGPCCTWPQESHPIERWAGPIPTQPPQALSYPQA